MASGGKSGNALTVVTSPAPHGIEVETLDQGDVVPFGPGSPMPDPFRLCPQPDRDMPRLAGHLIVINDRVFIEISATIGHTALEVEKEVKTSNRTVQIRSGKVYSPRDLRFDVLVRGTTAPWSPA
jgi:hypothetical protein